MVEGWGSPTLQEVYDDRCARPSDIVQHLPRLYSEASRPGVRVLELGVRSGNSTAAFLAAADQHGGRVVSVDINTPTVPPEFWQCGLWRFVKGDDLTLTGLVDEPVDVLFIDTSHHYGQTLAELRRFHTEVALDGCIILHDTELKNPEGAPASDPDFPVAAAIEDFVAEFAEWDAEFVAGCYGLAVLRRSLLVAA